MSIRSIEESKTLREAGKILGRAGVSERAIEIAKEIAANPGDYFRAVKGIGQMHALFVACRFDTYWTEKRNSGYYDEFYRCEHVIATKNGTCEWTPGAADPKDRPMPVAALDEKPGSGGA